MSSKYEYLIINPNQKIYVFQINAPVFASCCLTIYLFHIDQYFENRVEDKRNTLHRSSESHGFGRPWFVLALPKSDST